MNFQFFSTHKGGENDQVCDLQDNDCVEKAFDVLYFSKSGNLQACQCLPECNSVKYETSYIKDRFVPENLTDFENVATVSIYFADDEFTAYKRFESYGTVRLLSNIGGFLGLFLGISVLSIVEIVYFFTLRFVDDLWHKPSSL